MAPAGRGISSQLHVPLGASTERRYIAKTPSEHLSFVVDSPHAQIQLYGLEEALPTHHILTGKDTGKILLTIRTMSTHESNCLNIDLVILI